MYSASAETVIGISEFMVNFVEPAIIKLKDKLFPPSQKTLDKRLKGYSTLYMAGYKGALRIAQGALDKGANPNIAVDVRDENWNKVGSEPLLVTVTRANSVALVEALVKAGGNVGAEDSNGKSAVGYSSRKPTIAAVLKTSPTFNAAAPKDAAEKSGPAPTVATVRNATNDAKLI